MNKNVEDMTSWEIALEVIKENQPIDKQWLAHIKKTSTDEDLLNWCRINIENFVSNISKNKITRAAKALKILLFK
jgi:hypothetical protein